MALPVQDSHITEVEYLAFERESDTKHEYIAGEVYAMSGASPSHNYIVADVLTSLSNQLRGRPCNRSGSDLKVWIPSRESFFYPDVTITCGKSEFSEEDSHVLLNPTLVVEVLSPSTEKFDRGEKFAHYRELASLQEYVLIAQEQPLIERYLRQADGTWQFAVASTLESSIALPSIDCVLKLTDVYEQVSFAEESDASEEKPMTS